jgi:hypothetical protein
LKISSDYYLEILKLKKKMNQQQQQHHHHHHHQQQQNKDDAIISCDQDNVFDSILNATDRRMSWQQQRSTHKSFKPSLSAICK